ncbi:MAG: hypothetical protein AAF290_10585 [Pseudomonadota bacterium]
MRYGILVGVLTLMTATVSAQQRPEPPTAETVKLLYDTHGLPFTDDAAGRPALLVLSAGCGHCVTLAAQHKQDLLNLMTSSELNARFIEMTRAVTLEPKSLYKSAQQAAHLASLTMECANVETGADAVSLIADFGYAARHLAGPNVDTKRPLTTNWKDWVHLADVNAEGLYTSTAVETVRFVVNARAIDVAGCDQTASNQRIRQRFEALKTARVFEVPTLLLLPDDTHPEMEIWKYQALKDRLMQLETQHHAEASD